METKKRSRGRPLGHMLNGVFVDAETWRRHLAEIKRQAKEKAQLQMAEIQGKISAYKLSEKQFKENLSQEDFLAVLK